MRLKAEVALICRVLDFALDRLGNPAWPRALDAIVSHQVKYVAPPLQKIVSDDAAMASPPHRFGAHNRYVSFAAQLQELVERRSELR